MASKAQIQAEARALGLSDQGTAAQIQRRIDAYLESCHDTARALDEDYGEDLDPTEYRRPRDTAVGPFMLAGALLSGLFD